MLNQKNWEDMRREYELNDANREKLIRSSREIVRLSRQIIGCVHRDEDASILLKKLEQKKAELMQYNYSKLESGSYKAAMQEYVEAACLYAFFNGALPGPKELNVDSEHYLLGLCDLTGELSRKAVNLAIRSKLKDLLKIKDAVEEIYSQLSLFDFRNSELRKKFDGVKYALKRVEDISLELSLKGK